jgi:hypothetical protein
MPEQPQLRPPPQPRPPSPLFQPVPMNAIHLQPFTHPKEHQCDNHPQHQHTRWLIAWHWSHKSPHPAQTTIYFLCKLCLLIHSSSPNQHAASIGHQYYRNRIRESHNHAFHRHKYPLTDISQYWPMNVFKTWSMSGIGVVLLLVYTLVLL